VADGFPKKLAEEVATLRHVYSALDIVDEARVQEREVEEVARIYFALFERLCLKWLRNQVESLPVERQWHAHARGHLRDDLYRHHRQLTRRVLRGDRRSGRSRRGLVRTTCRRGRARVGDARGNAQHFELARLRRAAGGHQRPRTVDELDLRMSSSLAMAILASEHPGSREAAAELRRRYGEVGLDEAQVLVVLGGDGFMLHTLHENVDRDVPVFGMRLGEIGFLMNRYSPDDLPERIANAREVVLNPLEMVATTASGQQQRAVAINEVALLRQTNQAAHIRILVNGRERVSPGRRRCARGHRGRIHGLQPVGARTDSSSRHGCRSC
jgi:hypothetical protein